MRTLNQLGGVKTFTRGKDRRMTMLGYETQVKIIPEKGEGGEWWTGGAFQEFEVNV